MSRYADPLPATRQSEKHSNNTSYSDEQKKYKYVAFISYRHDDAKYARKLKRELQSYRLTSKTADKYNVPRSLSPFFLDQDDMRPGDLDKETKDELSKARFLIVICSRNVQKNPNWIDKEIRFFLESGHTPDDIIPFIVDESKHPVKELYPPSLRSLKEDGYNGVKYDLVGPSICDTEKDEYGTPEHKAHLKVIARIHGILVSEIERQDLIIQKRRMRVRAIIAAVITLAIAIAVYFVYLYWDIYYAPRINLTANDADHEIDAAIGDTVNFTLDIANFNREQQKSTPTTVSIQLPECIVCDDPYIISSESFGQQTDAGKVRSNNIFISDVDISEYIIDPETRLTFLTKVVDRSLRLDTNRVYVHAVVRNGEDLYEDTVSISITPQEAQNADVAGGWGDNSNGRIAVSSSDYNAGKLDGIVTFNRLVDGAIGHEFNFVGARADVPYNDTLYSGWNANSIYAEEEQVYIVRLYYHNLCTLEKNNEARDVIARFSLPTTVGKQMNVIGYLSSSNASPSVYWDDVVFYSDHDFWLEYIDGSAGLHNGALGKEEDYPLPNEIIVKQGAMIGYDKLDGVIPGGYQASGEVHIKLKVHYW